VLSYIQIITTDEGASSTGQGGSEVDGGIKRDDITQEEEIITVSTYEEIEIIRTKDETDASKPVPEPTSKVVVTEEKDITTESMYEEWEEVKSVETQVSQEVNVPRVGRQEITQEQDVTTESMYEEWEEVKSVETELEVPARHEVTKEQEGTTESMYEEWEVTDRYQTEVTNEVELPVARKQIKENEDITTESMYEEWEVTNRFLTETTQEIEVPLPKVDEEKSMYEEWEVVEKKQLFEDVVELIEKPRKQVDSDEESFFSETEINEKITRTETTIEYDERILAAADEAATSRTTIDVVDVRSEGEDKSGSFLDVEVDLKSRRSRSDSDNESFFSETEILEKVTTTETTIETTTTEKTTYPVSTSVTIEDRSCTSVTEKREITSGNTGIIGDRGDSTVSYDVRDIVLSGNTGAQSSVRKDGGQAENGDSVFYSTTETTVVHGAQGPSGTLGPASPSFTRVLTPATVNDGSTVRLMCQIWGNPRPEVRWFVDGIEIKTSADFRMTCNNEGMTAQYLRHAINS